MFSSSECALCGKPASQHCQRCKSVHYCCRDHQSQHWKVHKQSCVRAPTRGQLPSATARLGQLSEKEKKAGVFTTALTYETVPIGEDESLQCGIVLPIDFDPTSTYPVCIAISGEKQQHVSRFFQAWKSDQRGWIVVSPLRPNSAPLFFKAPAIIHKLALALLERFHVEGEKFHMVGTSNGGSTCFAFAARWPGLCHSVIPVTGANLCNDDLRSLNGLPIDMFVGDCDELGFCKAMTDILAELRRVKHTPPPTLSVAKGAGHFTIGQAINMEAFWRLMESRRPPTTCEGAGG